MKPCGRPKKYRIVKVDPKIVHFSPRGKPGRPEEIDLLVDELEALRLADLFGKDQKTAAQAMRISQQTFSRILRKARYRVADSLVNGKILRIQGGKYVVTDREDLPGKTFLKPAPKAAQK